MGKGECDTATALDGCRGTPERARRRPGRVGDLPRDGDARIGYREPVIVSKMSDTLVPRIVSVPTAATDTSDRMSAYSTRAWPSSRFMYGRMYAMRMSSMYIHPL